MRRLPPSSSEVLSGLQVAVTPLRSMHVDHDVEGRAVAAATGALGELEVKSREGISERIDSGRVGRLGGSDVSAWLDAGLGADCSGWLQRVGVSAGSGRA